MPFVKPSSMQKLGESETEVWFTVEGPSQIQEAEIINATHSGKNIRLLWPRQPYSDIALDQLSERFFIQLAFTGHPLAHKSDHLIQKETPETRALLVQILAQNLFELWPRKYESILQQQADIILNAANDRSTRFYRDEEAIQGAIVVERFKRFNGEEKYHIGWIWIESQLPSMRRIPIARELLGFAADVTGDEVMAAISSKNKRSIRFFEKAGFRSVCATLSLLQD